MAAIQNAGLPGERRARRRKGRFPALRREGLPGRPECAARSTATCARPSPSHGIRNGCLTSIAPTGTISLLAGNVSSGIEPVFDFTYRRRVLAATADRRKTRRSRISRIARFRAMRRVHRRIGETALPPLSCAPANLSPSEHLAMQAALQPFVDSAISKTINCPEAMSFEAFRDVYLEAYDMGLKGCTTYRPNPVTGAVLVPARRPAPPRRPPPLEHRCVAP